jgi:hypothetical protein
MSVNKENKLSQQFCSVRGMDKIRVSGSALTVKAQVQFQANPCEIYGGQSDTDKFFSGYFGFFPPSLSFHQCSILIHSPNTDTT